MSALLLPPVAHAGSYSPPTMGGSGQWYSGYNQPTLPRPYSTSSSGLNGGAGTGDSSGQINSFGDVTALYAWSTSTPATDPAPPCIVMQSCRTSWYGTYASSPASSCSDGFGDGEIKSSNGQNYQGDCNGTRYSLVTPDANGTFTLTLSGAQSHTPASNLSGFYYSTVSYYCTAYPVTVTLTGQNTANQALTGQQITATLSTPNGLPSDTKIAKYTWSFKGATAPNPIKNWDGMASGDSTHPQRVPLADADLGATDTSGNGISVNPISFYDEVQETMTLKCTVSLKFSDGTTATVNALSVPVAFLKPNVSAWMIDTGYIQELAGQPGHFGLFAAPGTGFSGGEYWHDITIDVPQPFSGGKGCLVQLITPGFEMYRDGATGPAADPNDQKQGLDNSFPYPGSEWTLPALGMQSDRPQYGVAGVNVPQYQGWNAAVANDSFITYVMYKPPAYGTQGVIWVPLQSYTWGSSFTLQWLNNQWTMTASDPSATTRASARSPVEAPLPPSWSLVQTNAH